MCSTQTIRMRLMASIVISKGRPSRSSQFRAPCIRTVHWNKKSSGGSPLKGCSHANAHQTVIALASAARRYLYCCLCSHPHKDAARMDALLQARVADQSSWARHLSRVVTRYPEQGNGFRESRVEHPERAGTNFRLGSVTKQFTRPRYCCSRSKASSHWRIRSGSTGQTRPLPGTRSRSSIFCGTPAASRTSRISPSTCRSGSSILRSQRSRSNTCATSRSNSSRARA